MRSYSFTCLALIVAGALACDSKGNGTSDTSEFDTDGSSSDGSGTDGVSSTDGTGGPMTSGGSSNTSASTSATSGSTSEGTTTGFDPSETATDSITSTGTTGTTTVGPVTATTGDVPPEPSPCEGEAVELDVAASAYLYSQQPPMPDPTGGDSTGSSGTGGDPLDPDTVFVRLSNQVATCADPNPNLECGLHWEISIAIPPSYQTPGLYHLHGPEITGHQYETGENEGGDCSFGGGSFDATFELIAIDDNTVTGRLCHVNSLFSDNKIDLEGSFSAPRCP